MSDSVRPHRWQPMRLPHPWDSPDKKTGVGYHFLLQCMKGKSKSEVAQSCPTLCDPMDCSPPSSSVHGIFQAGVLEWGAIAFSKYFVTAPNLLWLVSFLYFATAPNLLWLVSFLLEDKHVKSPGTTHQNSTWQWKQRLELCCCKSGNTKDCYKHQKPGRAQEEFLYRFQRDHGLTNTKLLGL